MVVRKVTAHMTLDDMARGAVGAQDFFDNAQMPWQAGMLSSTVLILMLREGFSAMMPWLPR